MDTEPIALAHHLGNLRELGGHLVGHLDLHLHPVVGFVETLQLLHVPGVVGVVVVDIHGRELVETIDKHTFAVGIDEAQRTGYLVHTLAATPLLDSLEQGGADLCIVDKVEPTEAYLMAVPPLVGTTVDDSSHASHHLAIAEGHEIFGLAAFEGGVLVFAQSCHLVKE